jgi:hypothetical protein
MAGMDRERSGGAVPGRLRLKLSRMLKAESGVDSRDRKKLLKLILSRQGMMRRKRLLEKTLKTLHFWHLLHLPFVVIMFLLLFFHVYVTFSMGHRWIF